MKDQDIFSQIKIIFLRLFQNKKIKGSRKMNMKNQQRANQTLHILTKQH